jgi:hypothetical protein
MKRLATIVAVLAVGLSASLGSAIGIASAAPSSTTSITLVCDKNVDAVVSLRLQASEADVTSLGEVDIACGPSSNVERQRNRVEIPTGALAANWVVVETWTNSADSSAAECARSGEITFKDTCTNDAGVGSQLTVR